MNVFGLGESRMNQGVWLSRIPLRCIRATHLEHYLQGFDGEWCPASGPHLFSGALCQAPLEQAARRAAREV